MRLSRGEEAARRVSQAGLVSGLAGPLVAQLTVGLLESPPDYFRPTYFLATYLVAVVLLGPGSMVIGLAGAEAASRLAERGLPLALAGLSLCLAGAAAGWLHYRLLVLIFGSASPQPVEGEILALDSLRAALLVSGAGAAAWTVFSRGFSGGASKILSRRQDRS